MKKSLAIVVGAAVLLAAGVPLVQNAKAAAPTAAATQSASTMDMKGQMGQMDEHMKTMQALHDRMMGASPPEERQKVMDEQRKEMQQCMATMSPMMQGGAMSGGTGSGMVAQKSTPADSNAQMQMMQKRMDMMQVMMQTMMDQQGAMAAPKGVDAAPKK